MSLPISLAMNGVRLSPWTHDSALSTFQCGTLDGLLDLRGGITLIAVFNRAPGNGEFAPFIALLEKLAVDHWQSFEIVQLWNDRLAAWFTRRGYTVSDDPEKGSFAKFRGVAEKSA